MLNVSLVLISKDNIPDRCKFIVVVKSLLLVPGLV